MDTNEFTLNDLPWDQQLKEVIKAYHKGVLTYVEYVLIQQRIINHALMLGVSFEKVNEFSA